MRQIKYWLQKHPAFRDLMLPALSLLFGIQLVRLFIPAMTWALGDRFDIGAVGLGGIAIIGFGLSLAVIPLRRFLCSYKALIFSAGGLGIIRLLAQINWGEPIVNLVLATIGVALLGMFLAIYLDISRLKGGRALSHLAIGLLLGWALDVSLNGLFSTYDYIFQSSAIPFSITIILVVAQWVMLSIHNPISAEPPATAKTLPWQAIGFFLFLEFIIFSNIAHLAAITGWTLPTAFGVILLGQLSGLFAATWLLGSRYGSSIGFGLVTSLLLLGSVVFLRLTENAPVIGFMLFLGQICISLLIATIIGSIGVHNTGRVYKSAALNNGLGMIILALLVLAYYAVYQISLPYPNTLLEIVAVVALAVYALITMRSYHLTLPKKANLYIAPLLALVLLIAPIASFFSWQDLETTQDSNDTVKVMSYNLHNGFNTKGQLDLETLTEVIEAENPDILALQEVSRGWLINGGVDMLSWLSQQLGMPYVSGPTADLLWGNAILSKYPITDYSNLELPPDDLALKRGFTAATIDIDSNQLTIIATHFHHIEEDSAIRQQQAPVLLDYYGGSAATVILGDLNAQPNTPEMKLFDQSGLKDTLADQPQVLTFHAADLYERIDYIWLSADLVLLDSYVPFSQASDHLAVVAIITIG